MRQFTSGNAIIVDLIGTIDDKIENNEKVAATLRALGTKIYDEITVGATQTVTLGLLCKFTNGYAFKSKDYVYNGDYRVITIKNIATFGFSADSAEYIDFKPEYKPFVLSIGDVLLTMTGEVGRTGIVDCKNCLLNQRVLKVASPSPFFTYFCLSANEPQIKILTKGSVQQNLGLKELSAYTVDFADWETYKQHDWMIEKLLTISTENTKLAELKTAYLKKFFV